MLRASLRASCLALLLPPAAHAAGAFEGLGLPPEAYTTSAYLLSRDGTTVFATGFASDADGNVIDRWTRGMGWERIASTGLYGGVGIGASSDDGRVAIGVSGYEFRPTWPLLIAPPGRGLTISLYDEAQCGENVFGFPGAGGSGTALSEDGSVGIGALSCESSEASVPAEVAARFLPTTTEILGTLPGDATSRALEVSADGQVVLGSSSGPGGERLFRWTPEGGLETLPLPAGARARLSRDGTAVATSNEASGASGQAQLWNAGEGAVPIGDLPGGADQTVVHGVLEDGSGVFGISSSGQGEEVFRFTRGGGLVSVGVLPGSGLIGRVSATTPDGERLFFSLPDPYAADREAYVWSAGAGMRRVQDVLAMYGLPLDGWTLFDVRDVSGDGRTWLGNGRGPDGVEQPWIATIPAGIGTLRALEGPEAGVVARPTAISGDGRTVFGFGEGPCSSGDGCVLRWLATPGGWDAAPAAAAFAPGLPIGVSRDGGVAAGNAAVAPSGTRGWRLLAGAPVLEGLPLPDDCNATISAVAWTGSVATGWSAACAQSVPVGGFVWSEAGGLLLGPGAYPTSVSADGRVVVGVRDIGSPPTTSPAIAFGWTEYGGFRDLAIVPPGAFERMKVSADASTIVGVGISGSGSELFRWTEGEGLRFLGGLPEGSAPTGPRAVSIDGSVIAGERATAQGTEAFVWTEATGLAGLGVLPGDVRSAADLVSFSGRLVFGRSLAADGSSRAFVWDAEGGLRGLGQALATELALDLEGWTLESVAGISDDGLTLTGIGMAADGRRKGWLLTLP